MKLNCISVATLVLFVTTATSQPSILGGKDYGLAASSVMWMPRGTSVFLNPAELGRIHQDEFLFNTNRFRNLGSMTGTVALPFGGTFAGGIANDGPFTTYTFGYGSLVGDYHTIGTALSIVSPIEGGFRLSFGTAFHFPFSQQRSGIHTGFSISNLPETAIVNAGIAWWIVSDWLRLQAAAQNRVHTTMLYGAEFLASDNFSFLFGTDKFKTMYGGVSLTTSTYTADLTAGPGGLTFSLNFILGESAEERRSISYEEGYNLFSEKRYSEAHDKFLLAVQYDEYDDDSRSMAENSLTVRDSTERQSLRQAKTLEENFDFAGAIDAYTTVLRVNPANIYAETLIVNTRRKLVQHVEQLIAEGDSLRTRKDITNARKKYDLALKFDPENYVASTRIDELESLPKENVLKDNINNTLSRALSMFKKEQLDNAQKEYERVLSLDPRNSRARAGLNAIRAKRKEEQFETAKEIYEQGKYFDALTMMLELSKQNIKNKELQSYIDKAREKLQPEVEKRFKTGLSYYVSENFDHAISVWDSALIIQPRHAGILEYRKRAEEKMKALELLK